MVALCPIQEALRRYLSFHPGECEALLLERTLSESFCGAFYLGRWYTILVSLSSSKRRLTKSASDRLIRVL